MLKHEQGDFCLGYIKSQSTQSQFATTHVFVHFL